MAVADDAPRHLVVKTVVPPTSVRFLERGRFRDLETEELLLGRASALELVCATADGDLQTISEQPLFCGLHDMQTLDRSSAGVRNTVTAGLPIR